MPYLVTTSLYPSEQAQEVGARYLEALEKYPVDESLSTQVVPAAVTTTHQGIKVIGEDWTAAQKEVWATIEAGWEASIKGDIESVMALRHENYLNLSSGNPTTINKDQVRKRDKGCFAGDYKLTSF